MDERPSLQDMLSGKARPHHIPANWLGEAIPDADGYRWWDPENAGNSVSLYNADESYVVVMANGKLLDRNGKPIEND